MVREYEITAGRVRKAYFWAILLGSLLVAVPMTGGLFFMNTDLLRVDIGEVIAFFIFVFLIAAFLWGVGLVLLGGPVWALMHNLKLYQWYHAAVTGIVILLSTIAVIYKNESLQPLGYIFLGSIGGIMGLIIWRIAYRKKEEDLF